MENKNNVIIIGLLALIAGLLVGYFSGSNQTQSRYGYMNGSMMGNMMSSGDMYEGMEEMMEHHDGDDDMGDAMGGMMMGLSGKTGAAFEEAFLLGMIVHHEGAVAMAKELLKQTKRPELVKLGNDIISAQTQEIGMMEGWLDTWF